MEAAADRFRTGIRAAKGARRMGAIVQTTAIAVALLWSLAPVYWMIATSLKTEIEAASLEPALWPHEATLENYRGLWNIRFDNTGEAVFDFDVLHMRKGGAITATRVNPQ